MMEKIKGLLSNENEGYLTWEEYQELAKNIPLVNKLNEGN